jgi:hypothetical protein
MYRRYWWQYGEKRPGLRAAIRGLDRVLVCSMVSKHFAFVFLPSSTICSHNIAVFPVQGYPFFSILQSRIHDLWTRFFSSTLEDRQGYRPTDCFETFPFPQDFETSPILDQAGRDYYDFRAALMVKNNEGLTKTYNRFHDPNETSPDILKLRDLHAAMDRAVLDAYGWKDLQPTCNFFLDYEEDEEENAAGGTAARRRKKPWRYRWPDDFRDEVLARLLALNKQRAEEERLAGEAAEAQQKKTPKRGKGKTGKKGGAVEEMF